MTVPGLRSPSASDAGPLAIRVPDVVRMCTRRSAIPTPVIRSSEPALGSTAWIVPWYVYGAGCCGLAGNFGFERGHYEVSKACGERVLLPAVRAAEPETLILADGFSCRTQIAQETGREAIHLAELLQLALDRQ